MPRVMPEWTARRILKELADGDRRRAVLADFWRHADATSRQGAQRFLAKALSFREVSLRKLPPERRAELLASRLTSPDAEPYAEEALVVYHTRQATALMGAFLDRWGIPHQDGAIVGEETTAPDGAQVREAVAALAGGFERGDIRLYLATAGLVMGDAWRAATWPVVDEMA